MQFELITPCGIITVERNGTRMSFDVCDNPYNTYWIDGVNGEDIAVHPDGCVELIIDLLGLHVGDYIVCALNNVSVINDGGGESQLNCIGQNNDTYIGIGAPDSDHYEYGWNEIDGDFPNDLYRTKRYLPYDCNHCDGGFEFFILDDPKLYRDRPLRKSIILSIVWCSCDKEYASDIVSFLTS